MLQRRDERKLHGLALFVAGLGRRIALLEPELLIGIGLQPNRFSERLAARIAGPGGPSAVDRKQPLGPSREGVETGIGRDPVEPRTEQPWAPEPGQRPPRAKQGLLESVLSVLEGAKHPIAVGLKLCAVGLDDATKRVLVAPAGRVEQLFL